MNLKILLPFKVFNDIKNVSHITFETDEGSYGLLPNRLDCVAALVPGIFTYKTETEEEHYLALDEGILVKAGMQIMVSVRNAIGGTDLGELRDLAEKEFTKLEESEKDVRSAIAKLESGFIQTLQNFRKI